MDALRSFSSGRIAIRERFFGQGAKQEFSIRLVRIVAAGAEAVCRLPAGLEFEHILWFVAIETKFPALFDEPEFFLGLVRRVTERALPVFQWGMRKCGLHEKRFMATGA